MAPEIVYRHGVAGYAWQAMAAHSLHRHDLHEVWLDLQSRTNGSINLGHFLHAFRDQGLAVCFTVRGRNILELSRVVVEDQAAVDLVVK